LSVVQTLKASYTRNAGHTSEFVAADARKAYTVAAPNAATTAITVRRRRNTGGR